MKKLMIIGAFASLVLSMVSAQEAEFSELNGKVEYQVPGKDWRPARQGDKIGKGTLVSTGFKSNVILKIGNTSINIKPITRLTLEEIIRTEGGTQTQLFLLSGRIKADVPPQANQKTEFRIKSPTATASVRGTEWEFDGINLLVFRGTVQMMTSSGQSRLVRIGEFTYITPFGTVSPPAAVEIEQGLARIDELVDQAKTSSISQIEPIPIEPAGSPRQPSAGLTITVQ
ncbi:FecR domain-containing protein [Treponema sp.]